MLLIWFKMQIKSHNFSFILMDSFSIWTCLLVCIYQYLNNTLGWDFMVHILRISKSIVFCFINHSCYCCVEVIICGSVLLPSTSSKDRIKTWDLHFLGYEYAYIWMILRVDAGPTISICNVETCNQREMNDTRFKMLVHICVQHWLCNE
jgi:hypothetical protein